MLKIFIFTCFFLIHDFTYCVFQIWKQWEYDHTGVHKGLQFWKTSCGKIGDRVRDITKWEISVQDCKISHVRIHDQFYTQIEAPAWKVYDEQRARKLYNFAGMFHHWLKTIAQPMMLFCIIKLSFFSINIISSNYYRW